MDKKKLAMAVTAGIAAIAVAAGILFLGKDNKEDLTATTMRILSYSGAVSLEDKGKETTLRENMLLHNGDLLATKKDSFVDINLDDTKAAGLDQDSSAEFVQEGKKLNINITAGGLYFYTTQKLSGDETFDIKTQSMMVGIRGTSGYFNNDPATGETDIYLTSGKLSDIRLTNPSTGDTKTVNLSAGQVMHVSFDSSKTGEASINVGTEPLKAKNIPGLLAQRLVEHTNVLNEVTDQLDINADKIAKNANRYLKQNPSAGTKEEGITPYVASKASEEKSKDNNNDSRETADTQQPADPAAAPQGEAAAPAAPGNNTQHRAQSEANRQPAPEQQPAPAEAQPAPEQQQPPAETQPAPEQQAMTEAPAPAEGQAVTDQPTPEQQADQNQAASSGSKKSGKSSGGRNNSGKKSSDKKNSGSKSSEKKDSDSSSDDYDDDYDSDDDDDDDDDNDNSLDYNPYAAYDYINGLNSLRGLETVSDAGNGMIANPYIENTPEQNNPSDTNNNTEEKKDEEPENKDKPEKEEKTLTRAEITGTKSEIKVQETTKLSLEIYFDNGDFTKGAPAKWESSDPSVASVTSDGVVKGLKAGQTTISAVANGHPEGVASYNITVTGANNAGEGALGVKIMPSKSEFSQGELKGNSPAVLTLTADIKGNTNNVHDYVYNWQIGGLGQISGNTSMDTNPLTVDLNSNLLPGDYNVELEVRAHYNGGGDEVMKDSVTIRIKADN